MNEPRTCANPSTPATQPRSRFVLIDKDGCRVGTYDSAHAAAILAAKYFPDQQQDPERSGKGWDIQRVR